METMLGSWSHATNFFLWCGLLLYTTGNLGGIFCNIFKFEIYAGSLAHRSQHVSADSRLYLTLPVSLT